MLKARVLMKREIQVRVHGSITEENKIDFHKRLAKMIVKAYGPDLIDAALNHLAKEK